MLRTSSSGASREAVYLGAIREAFKRADNLGPDALTAGHAVTAATNVGLTSKQIGLLIWGEIDNQDELPKS